LPLLIPAPHVEAVPIEAPDPDFDFGAWLVKYQAKRKARAAVLANSSYSKRSA
jgi:hypothetical protein